MVKLLFENEIRLKVNADRDTALYLIIFNNNNEFIRRFKNMIDFILNIDEFIR
jgi:hypothetical protein